MSTRTLSRPRVYWVRTCIVFGVMLACGVLLGLRQSAFMRPALEIEPSKLSLGEVWIGSAHKHEVVVSNTTSEPITITGFVASCPCASVHPSQLEIPANGFGKVELVFNLASAWSSERSGMPAPFRIRVNPSLESASAGPVTWTFSGTSRTLFRNLAGPQVLDSSRLVRWETRAMRDVLELAPVVPLRSIYAETDFPHCRIDASSIQDGCRLTFDFVPSTPEATHRFDVALKVQPVDGEIIGPVWINIVAPIGGPWEPVPPQLDLGLLEPGETTSRSVVIHSRIGLPAPRVRAPRHQC